MADSDATLDRERPSTSERVDGGSKSRPISESTTAMQNTEVEDEETEPEQFKAGFFDKDPFTTQQRKIYLKIMAMGSFLTILVVFCVLSIYWGSLWQATSKISKMHGWIVDFDGGSMGEVVRETVLNATGPPQVLTWQVVDPSQFPNGPSDLEKAIVDERAWVVVSINPGASAALSQAITTANASYNGTLAVTAYAEEARNENSYPLVIVPQITDPLTKASQLFSTQNAERVASNSSINFQNLLATAPNTLANPMFFTVNNVRPFDVPVATAIDFVGLIYLLILSFIISMMNYNARVVRSALNRHLRTSALLRLRLFSPLITYFIISFFYSLLDLAFQVPFRRFFGGWGFIIIWMVNWMGMCALGFAMEAMVTLLTPAFVPFFLVVWIITNVSVSFFPIEMLPGVFRYGYAMPFYQVSRTVRAVIFGTRNQIGLNFGVLFAWIAVSMVTIPVIQWILHRRMKRQHNRALIERNNIEKGRP